jgi:hypothetical protein
VGDRHQVAADLPTQEAIAAKPNPRTPMVSACGGLVVRLITQAEDQKWAFASMAQGFDEPAKIRRVGDVVGGYRVASIEWDRVWVQGGSGRCAVGIHLGAREGQAEVKKSQGGVVEVSDPAPPWALPAEVVAGLHKRSETEYNLERVTIDALFARGADVFAGMSFEPVYNLEALIGLRLLQIRLDSLLERLGLQSKDLVRKIDGQPITTPEQAIAALERARVRGELIAELERDGETFELSLRVANH